MLVMIKGAGDIASGIALRLWRAGINVVMTDLPKPSSIRRTVCFSEAVYRLGKADGAADGRRLRKIGHHNVDPRAPEPQRNAGGNVSGAFYHYEHSLFPLEMVLDPV